MCRHCLKDPGLTRGRLCSDSGALIPNFDGCHSCLTRNRELRAVERSVVKRGADGDCEEVVTYVHVCSSCGHKVATHRHEFRVEEDYQEYRMDCGLCGVGEDSMSVMPYDPKKASVRN